MSLEVPEVSRQDAEQRGSAPTTKGEQMRARLLQAAGEVFAERGFKGATVELICKRAKTNIASVNYYFRDKRSLYLEAFRYAATKATETLEPIAGAQPYLRLKSLTRRDLRVAFGQGRSQWYLKLVFREMLEPIGAMKFVFEEHYRPAHEFLKSLARETLGFHTNDRVVRTCAFIIMAISAFYGANQQFIERLYPGQEFDAEEIEQVAELIAQFLLGGMLRLKSHARAKVPRTGLLHNKRRAAQRSHLPTNR